jgi:hypothetical protein
MRARKTSTAPARQSAKGRALDQSDGSHVDPAEAAGATEAAYLLVAMRVDITLARQVAS